MNDFANIFVSILSNLFILTLNFINGTASINSALFWFFFFFYWSWDEKIRCNHRRMKKLHVIVLEMWTSLHHVQNSRYGLTHDCRTFSLCQNAKNSNTYHSDVCDASFYSFTNHIKTDHRMCCLFALQQHTITLHSILSMYVCVRLILCVRFVKQRSYAWTCVFGFRAHSYL